MSFWAIRKMGSGGGGPVWWCGGATAAWLAAHRPAGRHCPGCSAGLTGRCRVPADRRPRAGAVARAAQRTAVVRSRTDLLSVVASVHCPPSPSSTPSSAAAVQLEPVQLGLSHSHSLALMAWYACMALG